jgi:hypothetical protein
MTADGLTKDEVERLIGGGAVPHRIAHWEINGQRHYACVHKGIGGEFAWIDGEKDSIGLRRTTCEADMQLTPTEIDLLATSVFNFLLAMSVINFLLAMSVINFLTAMSVINFLIAMSVLNFLLATAALHSGSDDFIHYRLTLLPLQMGTSPCCQWKRPTLDEFGA